MDIEDTKFGKNHSNHDGSAREDSIQSHDRLSAELILVYGKGVYLIWANIPLNIGVSSYV